MADCDRCGEPATAVYDTDPYGYGPATERFVSVCADCFQWYENREPPDQEGEPPMSLAEQSAIAWKQKDGRA
jgi:hypothetical protein